MLAPVRKRRKLNLKAKLEGSSSHYSFKRLVPGAFSVGFIGSICNALPCPARVSSVKVRLVSSEMRTALEVASWKAVRRYSVRTAGPAD